MIRGNVYTITMGDSSVIARVNTFARMIERANAIEYPNDAVYTVHMNVNTKDNFFNIIGRNFGEGPHTHGARLIMTGGKYIKTITLQSLTSFVETNSVVIAKTELLYDNIDTGIRVSVNKYKKVKKTKEVFNTLSFQVYRELETDDMSVKFIVYKNLSGVSNNTAVLFAKRELELFTDGSTDTTDGIDVFMNSTFHGRYSYKLVFTFKDGFDRDIASSSIRQQLMYGGGVDHQIILTRMCKMVTPRNRGCNRNARFTSISTNVVSLDHGMFRKIMKYGNYYVKEKVDGLRMLLYIKNNDFTYVTNKESNIVPTKPITGGTGVHVIIDGETYDTHDGTPHYQAFDIIFASGRTLVDVKFTDRQDVLHKTIKTIKRVYGMDINVGVYSKIDGYPESEWSPKLSSFKAIKTLLNTKRDYDTDGLIFVPDSGYMSNIYKWKPVHQLTIDFIVNYQGMKMGKYNYRLYVHVSKSEFEAMKEEHLPSVYPYHQQAQTRYFPIPFQPKSKSKVKMLKSSTELVDNDVYELGWTENGWTVIKHRSDKKVANNVKTANTNWALIKNPLTEDMLLANEPLPDEDYFTSSIRKANVNDLRRMNAFHSNIKRGIYKSLNIKGKILLDVGSGRFPDLQKWNRSAPATVIAVEPSATNVSYGREQYDNFRHILFDLVTYTDTFFDVGDELIDKYEHKINLITMFYSVHYMLPDVNAYDELISLVDTLLDPSDRRLIFVSYDGRKMLDLLRYSDNGVYRFDGKGSVVVSPENFNPVTDKFYVGMKVNVYIESIGAEHTEYLIDLELMKSMFADAGYSGSLVPYGDKYQKYVSHNRFLQMRKGLQDMSFLYTICMFE